MAVATGLRVLDYGDHALLLDFDSTAEVLAWADALHHADLLGVVELVSASRTVLIKVESRRYLPLSASTSRSCMRNRPTPSNRRPSPTS